MMNRFFTLLLAASCLTAVGQEPLEIIYSNDSTSFFFETNPATWQEAQDFAIAYGGHLATFSDSAENFAILAILPVNPEGYWFGLNQVGDGEEPDGGWGWVTSEDLSFTGWSQNEPNDSDSGNPGTDEDCGEIFETGWNDQYCHELNQFIVEIPNSKLGCIDESACNYDNEADHDDGSCLYPDECGECGGDGFSGCTDSYACNFDAAAACDDGGCDYSCCPGPGCCDVGTEWSWASNTCIVANPSDSNFDGCVQLNDLLDLLSAYGDCGAEESVWQCGDPLEYQGYDYETVQIGEQCWFAENLRAESYRNGEAIPTDLSDSEWQGTAEGAVSVYDGDLANLGTYGRLYSWYAVNDTRGLCPSGWHVPADGEWMTMEIVLGMSEAEANDTGLRGTDQGTQMKMDYGWHSGGNGTNSSGFSGLPGGYRDQNGTFAGVPTSGNWWCSSPNGSAQWYRGLSTNNGELVFRGTNPLRSGFSIRCIKD